MDKPVSFYLTDSADQPVRVELHKLSDGRRQLYIGHGDSDLIILDEDAAVSLASQIMGW